MAFVAALWAPRQRGCTRAEVTCGMELPRRHFVWTLGTAVVALPSVVRAADRKTGSLYDMTVSRGGQKEELAALNGKVSLVVNVATYCALTPQYEGLAQLYDKYSDQGFEVLAFPCNQFGNQEPGDFDDICAFAREAYGARFTIFDKVTVNGPNEDSVYRFLKSANPESASRIEWNFAKFLVDRDGTVVRRYKPGILPNMIEKDISALLANKPLPPRVRPQLGAV